MALKKLIVSEYGVKMKATIQASGKLSFTDATAKNLELGDKTRFAIYQDDKAPLDVLYMVRADQDDEAFPVRKSGMYYYLATRTLFDILGIDYKHVTMLYDIVRDSSRDAETGGETYRLTRRVCGLKTQKGEVEEEEEEEEED